MASSNGIGGYARGGPNLEPPRARRTHRELDTLFGREGLGDAPVSAAQGRTRNRNWRMSAISASLTECGMRY
jgi:hypothetical protein